MSVITELDPVRIAESADRLLDLRTDLKGDTLSTADAGEVPTGIVVDTVTITGTTVRFRVTPDANTAGQSFRFRIEADTTGGQKIRRDCNISVVKYR